MMSLLCFVSCLSACVLCEVRVTKFHFQCSILVNIFAVQLECSLLYASINFCIKQQTVVIYFLFLTNSSRVYIFAEYYFVWQRESGFSICCCAYLNSVEIGYAKEKSSVFALI